MPNAGCSQARLPSARYHGSCAVEYWNKKPQGYAALYKLCTQCTVYTVGCQCPNIKPRAPKCFFPLNPRQIEAYYPPTTALTCLESQATPPPAALIHKQIQCSHASEGEIRVIPRSATHVVRSGTQGPAAAAARAFSGTLMRHVSGKTKLLRQQVRTVLTRQ